MQPIYLARIKHLHPRQMLGLRCLAVSAHQSWDEWLIPTSKAKPMICRESFCSRITIGKKAISTCGWTCLVVAGSCRPSLWFEDAIRYEVSTPSSRGLLSRVVQWSGLVPCVFDEVPAAAKEKIDLPALG